LYSPASIGKAYHEKLGLRSFFEKNPNFDKNILGHVMSTYYGGRSEVRIRKEPRRVTYIDFMSMYPTVYCLMGMDRFLKAAEIECVDDQANTDRVQKYVEDFKIDRVNQKETWKKLHTICLVKPQDDILPVRSKYDGKTYNIGINYLTSIDEPIWYTLPDILASKILTGKNPHILRAITFKPKGMQEGLNELEILPGIKCPPDKDFIQMLIEQRDSYKKERDKYKKGSSEYRHYDILQLILKIIANATSYGIFIEVNTSDSKEREVEAYWTERSMPIVTKMENVGRAYNPIIAVFLTAGSRLILAAAESLAKQDGGYYVCCDTDSIFVSPDAASKIRAFFRYLNPYNITVKDMFKVENDDEEKLVEDAWCYGISAKRYVLYDYDESSKRIKIRKYTYHGLGENLLGLDHREVWDDILNIHYGIKQADKVLAKYDDRFTMSQFTISSSDLFNKFKASNKGQPLNRTIKPFNFIIVGQGYRQASNGDPIIPMVPYVSSKNNPEEFEEIPDGPFTDFKSGKKYPYTGSNDPSFYWKPIRKFVSDYMDHPESKSEPSTGIGELGRKHLTVSGSSMHPVGKETNDLDKNLIMGTDPDSYTQYASDIDIVYKIMTMSLEEARKRHISETWLYDTRKLIDEDKRFPISKGTLRKLLK
jgi:hypothetical protein